jgi:hypothetical protein
VIMFAAVAERSRRVAGGGASGLDRSQCEISGGKQTGDENFSFMISGSVSMESCGDATFDLRGERIERAFALPTRLPLFRFDV